MTKQSVGIGRIWTCYIEGVRLRFNLFIWKAPS